MKDYIINSDGTIISTKFGKRIVMKPSISKTGYYSVSLSNYGKLKTHLIHRLVAIKYIPNPLNLPEVNHIDGDKSNNNVSNLEWCTRSENQQHAFKTGLNSRIGSINAFSILNEEQVIEIRNKYIPKKYTITQLALEYNVSFGCIESIVYKQSWKHLLPI